MHRQTVRDLVISCVVLIALTGCHAATPSGLATATATSAQTSTSTPTQRPTRTPQPTATPAATATLSPISGWGQRPIRPATRYRLDAWTAADLQQWLELEFKPYPESESGSYDAWTDGSDLRIALRREIVSRFAGSTEADAAQTALIDPAEYVGATSVPAEPFRAAFQQALNDGDVRSITAEDLTRLLAGTPYGEFLSVWDVRVADNVLGDGETGWVIDVRLGAEMALPLAISGRPGHYRVATPQTDWSRFAWSDHDVRVQDLNANDIPELAVWESHWGTGMSHFCVEEYAVYEWNGAGFANLTPDLHTAANTDSGGCLDFEVVAGADGRQAVTTGNTVAANCWYADQWGIGDLVILRRYEWNGSYFSLSDQSIQPAQATSLPKSPINPCTLIWVNEAGVENAQARALLPQLLDSDDPALIDGFAESFGPAWRDYFTLKLGVWHALQGDSTTAIRLLESVRAAPAVPDYSKASEMATAFVDAYGRAGAFAGCAAVNAQLDLEPFALEYMVDGMSYRMGQVREAWGFSDWQWGLAGGSLWSGALVRHDALNVCNLDAALRLSVRGQTFTDSAQLEAWLAAREIPYTGLVATDLDGDGRQDWLLLAGTEFEQSFAWWAILNRPGAAQAIWLGRPFNAQGTVAAAADTFSPDPHGRPVTVLQWPSGLMAFRLTQSGDSWVVESLLPEVGSIAEEMQLGFIIEKDSAGSADSDVLRVHFTYSDIGDDEWMTLAWDDIHHQLVDVDSAWLRQTRQVREVERLLFEARDPAGAAAILDTLLNETIVLDDPAYRWRKLPRLAPYLWYLRGVTAEAQGQDAAAVEAYWTVWDRYPTHPLAAIAQDRLTPWP